jgi:MFS family permease
VRERADVRAFVAANALWELSFMGLKTFIVLFVVKGLGESVGTASAVIGVVAGAYVIAAFGAGRLADIFGIHRVMRISIWVYGVGLLVGAGLSSLDSFLIGLPFIALAGAVVMTSHMGSGRDDARRGRGRALRPLRPPARSAPCSRPIVVGVAIDVLAPVFPRPTATAPVGRHRRADPALAALPRRLRRPRRARGRPACSSGRSWPRSTTSR